MHLCGRQNRQLEISTQLFSIKNAFLYSYGKYLLYAQYRPPGGDNRCRRERETPKHITTIREQRERINGHLGLNEALLTTVEEATRIMNQEVDRGAVT
jgi:hypothetical protein